MKLGVICLTNLLIFMGEAREGIVRNLHFHQSQQLSFARVTGNAIPTHFRNLLSHQAMDKANEDFAMHAMSGYKTLVKFDGLASILYRLLCAQKYSNSFTVPFFQMDHRLVAFHSNTYLQQQLLPCFTTQGVMAPNFLITHPFLSKKVDEVLRLDKRLITALLLVAQSQDKNVEFLSHYLASAEKSSLQLCLTQIAMSHAMACRLNYGLMSEKKTILSDKSRDLAIQTYLSNPLNYKSKVYQCKTTVHSIQANFNDQLQVTHYLNPAIESDFYQIINSH